ncbi:2-oxoglutarate dehydrogenase E2 component (dihydrolipoamide succinyltransferase) [Mucilaginibacter pineti]|uniref:Dihydrolipoamide acetyltransferase component of pyruvate dehydrogenase complex n=1 Tax=Mucilaginibacter pineti TaxID=1391627 RepID=A0A1G6TYV7_9SPHI|nr:dihydrolipoamide acetyltransferase family protein [Mucilaginibacter pineti]SDD33547.1 2-oxoglutarate dehydrogenase E2 component (dihydrolipoamide succinyltransferase) [Mucilaginibacter pineti]
MAKYQLLLPKMGESVAEATIIKWTKNPGDHVDADEAVMEIATDKVDSDVPSPVAGKLIEQLYKENDVVQVGAVIAIIETAEEEAVEVAPVTVAAPATEEKIEEQPPVVEEASAVTAPEITEQEPDTPAPVDIPGLAQLEQTAQPVQEAFKSEGRFYSPLVRNIASQEGIRVAELDTIPGTGAEGRLTKDDLLSYLQNRQNPTAAKPPVFEEQIKAPVAQNTAEPAAVPVPVPLTDAEPAAVEAAEGKAPIAEKAAAPQPTASQPGTSVSGGDEIIEMDRMRRLIADHMVMSKQTSPHVTSFVEADVTSLVLWREKVKNSFEKREGEKITFTPIFIEAVVKAIKDFPMINVTVNGTQIIKKANINISMATALPSGNLIVPVIKKADELSLLGITKAVNDLANRARIGKLLPDDVRDGTFTITNVGSFGNVMGTPIINQPQVAILAVGAIKKKPAVIETPEGDAIAIRHMMFLSLSYDHRVVDGALGGSFVRRVADYLEKWDPNRVI